MKRLELYDDTTSTDDVIRVEKSRLVGIQDGYINDENGITVIKKRDNGPFRGRGIYLDSTFDWVLGEDTSGLIVLIPLKKK